MLYKKLNHLNTNISKICLGGNIFGYLADQTQTIKLINQAGDNGINFIDTADTYSEGISETYIGNALKKNRHKWIIASKCGLNSHQATNGLGSKHSIIQKLDGSLKRLKTDYIDIYQMHGFDKNTPLEETYSTLSDCIKSGKIRSIGISNYSTEQIIETTECIKKNNFSPIVSAQCNFNLLNQNAIHNLFPTCNQHGISVLAYGVLARGILGGAYGKNLPIPDDSRAKISDSIESDLTPEILEIITKLKYQSKKIGISLPILSISWALSYSTLASAIIGIKNIKHLEGVVAAANKKIDTSIFTDLVKISSYSWNGKNLSMNA
jgi:aryl-alcohol dehydrogenase-like predicted oxidoreductase|tara:strand:- start:9471 stop:10436 length:966 start_codon:yes stop_codon:yes gene_type:complete